MAHGHHHHHHAPLTYERAHVDPDVLRELDAAFPALAEVLSLSERYGELTDEEKQDAGRLSETVEKEGPFTVGFHAEGDLCAVCEKPTTVLFEDAFQDDARLQWAAFEVDLPVHPACVGGMPEKFPKPVPRVVDQARRRLIQDATRPSAQVAAFFRHDVLVHGSFDLEDWANSVVEANPDMDRRAVKGIEKLIQYVHERLYH